jgi:GNAT superfamily N-acetyltransferase
MVIGGAAYYSITLAPQTCSAELAFTVEDDYQGRGIASLLMRHIARIARQNGLKCLEADVLPSNLPMLAVFRCSGLPMVMRPEGDTVHVMLFLQAGNHSGHAGGVAAPTIDGSG